MTMKYTIIISIISFSLSYSNIEEESCTLEWCGERELKLPSKLLIESCKLVEEAYKVEVLNKKLDYLQASCLHAKSMENGCWNGTACSCNDCESLVHCCISSQKCTIRILRSQIGIQYQRALSVLHGSITKCRLDTEKALISGMTREDADIGILILGEIRIYNQQSPRLLLGPKTKTMISQKIRRDLRPVIVGNVIEGEISPLIIFSRKGRDLFHLLEMVDGRSVTNDSSIVDGEVGNTTHWIYHKGNNLSSTLNESSTYGTVTPTRTTLHEPSYFGTSTIDSYHSSQFNGEARITSAITVPSTTVSFDIPTTSIDPPVTVSSSIDSSSTVSSSIDSSSTVSSSIDSSSTVSPSTYSLNTLSPSIDSLSRSTVSSSIDLSLTPSPNFISSQDSTQLTPFGPDDMFTITSSTVSTTVSNIDESTVTQSIPINRKEITKLSPSIVEMNEIRRKESEYETMKKKLKKKIRFYDLRKAPKKNRNGILKRNERGEIKRSSPIWRLTKKEKEILKNIIVDNEKDERTSITSTTSSTIKSSKKNPFTKKRGEGPDRLFTTTQSIPTYTKSSYYPYHSLFNFFSPKIILNGMKPLETNEMNKNELYSMKSIGQFNLSPQSIHIENIYGRTTEIRRTQPRQSSIKDLEYIEKNEQLLISKRPISITHINSTHKPPLRIIHSFFPSTSTHKPIERSIESYSILSGKNINERIRIDDKPSSLSYPPKAIHPPTFHIPIHSIPHNDNNINCSANIYWCGILSICLIDATSINRFTNGIDHKANECAKNSLSKAREYSMKYSECLISQRCSLNDEDCIYGSSLPHLNHCIQYFHPCQQIAHCCPLTQRCSRLSVISPSFITLDTSCLLCNQGIYL